MMKRFNGSLGTPMPKTLFRKTYLAVAIALVAGPAEPAPEATTPELSQQCGDLVAKLYKEAWPKGVTDDGGSRAKFESHYNSRLGKCFLLETVTGVARSPALRRILPRETQRLAEANERKDYGQYDRWDNAPPATCWLQQQTCNSREEWVRLIKPFMEE